FDDLRIPGRFLLDPFERLVELADRCEHAGENVPRDAHAFERTPRVAPQRRVDDRAPYDLRLSGVAYALGGGPLARVLRSLVGSESEHLSVQDQLDGRGRSRQAAFPSPFA